MLIVKNCPIDDQVIRFLENCKSKFEWLYPVKLIFKNRGPYKAALGCYYPDSRTITVPLYTYTKHTLLSTIAHEIRHVQQHMHNLDLGVQNSEQDANGTARVWVAEFGETKRDAGASLKRVQLFKADPSNIGYPTY